MKNKSVVILFIIAIISFPLSAKKHLNSVDSICAYSSKNSLEKISQKQLFKELSSDTTEEDDVDSAIISFEYNNIGSWKENITKRLNNILTSPMLKTVQAGIMIWDLTEDSILFKYNERLLLRPASTMKCITAIASLDKLSSAYNYQTTLYYTGNINDSTQSLEGDVYVLGGMDPMFGKSDMTSFVSAIKNLGIRHITGTLYADLSFKDSNIFGQGWCWDDKNPILTPLLYNKKDDFLYSFYHMLNLNGITIANGYGIRNLPTKGKEIINITHKISDIMDHMMKASDNLYAESMFYQLASNKGVNKQSSANNARFYIKQLIRKIGLVPSVYKIADGSGLSLYNYVSAELEVKLLRYAYQHSDIYNTLLNTLPLAGVSGTLKKRMQNTPAARNVRAKTGTVIGVSSLAGYLTAANGHIIAFSIINNGGLSNIAMHSFQNKICIALCQ